MKVTSILLTKKLTLNNWLLLSAIFSCLLLCCRMLVTLTIEYIFLPWNLVLAYIPFFITRWLDTNMGNISANIKRLVVFIGWLLFIPNSFYIITDIFHITHVHTAPKWFDLLLIFSFAWNGILAGIISISKMAFFTEVILNKKMAAAFIVVTLWLCALGVYIGRYLRFNSWDVLTNPFSLIAELFDLIFHPFQNGVAWGMTGCYALFMILLYFTFEKLSESFVEQR